jgi:mannosylglucosylglycerate synthase
MLAAVVSFRLGAADGVSVEAAKWSAALHRLGWTVRTVAGDGRADVLLPGLDLDQPVPPAAAALARALDGADVVLVENLLSLPRNLPAAELLAGLLRGRPALLHHHDLPWQRDGQFSVTDWPPDDPSWRHIAINELSRGELAARGVPAVTVYNTVDAPARTGRRWRTRRRLGIARDQLLLLQPTRAIARKNVPAGIRLAEQLGAAYWLTGPAEDGYADTLSGLLDAARCPVRRRVPSGLSMSDAYAAADAVVFGSTWEGFGNPILESAVFRRPLAVGDYPVLHELHRYGFRWFSIDDPDRLRAFLSTPDSGLHDTNAEIARRYFAPDTLDRALEGLLADVLAGPRSAADVHLVPPPPGLTDAPDLAGLTRLGETGDELGVPDVV